MYIHFIHCIYTAGGGSPAIGSGSTGVSTSTTTATAGTTGSASGTTSTAVGQALQAPTAAFNYNVSLWLLLYHHINP